MATFRAVSGSRYAELILLIISQSFFSIFLYFQLFNSELTNFHCSQAILLSIKSLFFFSSLNKLTAVSYQFVNQILNIDLQSNQLYQQFRYQPLRIQYNIIGMRESEDYKQICQIGQGAFGRVYKAINKDNKVVAIKQIKFDSEEEGIPATALREISLLKSLKSHPNIVPLIEIQYKHKQKILQIVFQYFQYDLKRYILSKDKLTHSSIRNIMTQILNGLVYCHCRKVIHRDLKPQNILVDKEENVKLADFGLGRALIIPLKSLTRQVQTLWYRAPELLLGKTKYTFAVDMWAVGCIFAELTLKTPLFMGNGHQIQQIYKIFKTLGTPTSVEWPEIQTLPDYKCTFPKWQKQQFSEILPEWPSVALDLLSKMLCLDPQNRITAIAALEHPYFKPDLEF